MGLRFVFGGSGSGKSTYIQNMILQEAAANSDCQYFLIVPDQFTMQTQKEIVQRSEDGGIINIDVLSFSRLTYRIFSEVGKPDYALLDDTGKCLVIRKVSGELADDLKVLKKGINNPGWAENVKAALSEFMQYHILPEDLEAIIANTGRMSVRNKLTDLLTVYNAFLKECAGKYTTRENLLEVLCERIPQSRIIPRTVICFDGFTGFTPIQVNVIKTLLMYSKEVYISLPVSREYEESLFRLTNEDKENCLFYLTKRTINDFVKDSKEAVQYVFLPKEKDYPRFAHSKELKALEENLFRPRQIKYDANVEDIAIVEARNIENECDFVCKKIIELVCKHNMRYRDIAIVTGDLESYKDILRRKFSELNMEFYIDENREIMSNQLIVFLRFTFALLTKGYNKNDVINLLKSGLCDDLFTEYDINLLDNYIRARNIRGYGNWNKEFDKYTRNLPRQDEKSEGILKRINDIRERFIGLFDCFYINNRLEKRTVREWLRAIYTYMDNLKLEEKMQLMSEDFDNIGEHTAAKEYKQIYRTVIELFEQIDSLMAEEVMTTKEFAKLLESGYAELRVGIIPKTVDLITIGDIQRSRLGEIKALFFMGVNDGKVPGISNKGGILSMLDKQYLLDNNENIQLSPLPREEIFKEQLYLYLNVTKPSEKLYISYSLQSIDYKALFPSYFIKTVMSIFSKLDITNYVDEGCYSIEEYKREIASLIGRYAYFDIPKAEEDKLMKLCAHIKAAGEDEWLLRIIDKAFSDTVSEKLEARIADSLYRDEQGNVIVSVSSLEDYAGCHFKFFLDYGLRLTQREEYSFEYVDSGNVFHDIMSEIFRTINEENLSISDLDDTEKEELTNRIIEKVSTRYNEGILKDNPQLVYYTGQIKRIVLFNINVIQKHLSRGEFKPLYMEKKISKIMEIEENGKKTYVEFHGKVDRIDKYFDDEKKIEYIKVIDYKTSDKKISLPKIEKGVSIQLPLYLNVLCEAAPEKTGYTCRPAAGLYYIINDDIIAKKSKNADDVLNDRISARAGAGIINGACIEKLDKKCQEKPKILPIKTTKGEVISTAGSVLAGEDTVCEFIKNTQNTALELTKEMIVGNIDVNPLEIVEDKYIACSYCKYSNVCGYDSKTNSLV